MRTALATILLAAFVGAAPAADGVRLAQPWPSLAFEQPVWLTWPAPDVAMVLERRGRVRGFRPGEAAPVPWVALDLTDRVNSAQSEEGLLCLAFHPKWPSDPRAFAWYTIENPKRNRLSCFTAVAGDPTRLDPASERVLLDIDDFAWNHNGGTTLFGPDGMLYLSTGDGGGGGDPKGNGQRRDTLLGKVLRIDVDRQDPGLPYAIPQDNPFAGIAGVRGEIWAWGCRNMWRMSFDRATGELWAGDVGQNAWEEVDLVVKGGNYGWNLREGTHPYQGGVAPAGVTPIEPVIDYAATVGKSVTGGYVYRGKRVPALVGAYVYADFVSGRVWALTRQDGTVTANRELLRQPGVASFAEDPQGEVYALSYGDGRILRFEP